MVEVGERFAQVKLEVAGVFRAVGQLGGLEGGRVGLEHLVQVVDYRRRRMVRARTCQRSGVGTGTDECLWLTCKADWGEWEEEEEEQEVVGTHWRISLDWRREEGGWMGGCQYIRDHATLEVSIKDQISQESKQYCLQFQIRYTFFFILNVVAYQAKSFY